MRCPNCDYENSVYSAFCQGCGASLEVNPTSQEAADSALQPLSELPAYADPSVYQAYEAQYQAPPPPPLNGHNKVPPLPPPLPEYGAYETDGETYGHQTQIPGDYKVYETHTRWTVSRVFRSILYFIAVSFSGFWLLAAFIEIDQNGALPYIAFVAWLAMIIGSIIVFVRVRQHKQRLRFSQFLFRLMAATIISVVALVVETALVPDLSTNALGSFILGMILMLYFLAIAVFALR